MYQQILSRRSREEFLKFLNLNMQSFLLHIKVRMVRGYNSRKIFEDQVKLLPKDLKRRLKYFRVFLQTKRIHLYPIYSKTDRDGERLLKAILLLSRTAISCLNLCNIIHECFVREYYSSVLVSTVNNESPEVRTRT